MDIIKLTVNTDKTKYLFLKTPNKTNINVTYNHRTIERVPETTYLGVIINQQIDWKQHIVHVQSKTSAIADLLRRITIHSPKNKNKKFIILPIPQQTYIWHISMVLHFPIDNYSSSNSTK